MSALTERNPRARYAGRYRLFATPFSQPPPPPPRHPALHLAEEAIALRYAGRKRERESLEARAIRLIGTSEDHDVGFTGFIGPSGALIDVDNDDLGHEGAARLLGMNIGEMLDGGLARVDLTDTGYLAVEFRRPLTAAQMRVIREMGKQAAGEVIGGGEANVDVTRSRGAGGYVLYAGTSNPATPSGVARLLREGNAVAAQGNAP